ncbi:MAG: hypothetical protein NXI21_08750 [Alphaproteobacteria bacterium]|nr:hypothetical protein [Alphaproteobacteria bacterium]
MIIDGNTPAALAAQSLATQREGLQQRTDGQQAAADRAQTTGRAFADRANGATQTQTRQSIGASDGQNQTVSADRGTPSAFPGGSQGAGAPAERSAAPPPSSGRGQVVDLFA